MGDLPTFTFVTAKVRDLDERFHALIAKEQAGTISHAETVELDTMCAVKEGRAVPPIPVEHLEFLMEGKRA